MTVISIIIKPIKIFISIFFPISVFITVQVVLVMLLEGRICLLYQVLWACLMTLLKILQ